VPPIEPWEWERTHIRPSHPTVDDSLHRRRLEAVERLQGRVRAELAARRLRRDAARANTLEELTELAFDFEHRGVTIAPYQVKPEIVALLELIRARAPRRIVEIGTFRGGTLFLFTRVAAADALLISIDLLGGRFGGGYPEERRRFYRSFACDRQRIELVLGGSHARATRDRVVAMLDGDDVDFLFIDGDHTYGAVRRDFEMYAPLVSPHGLIALHDIVPGPSEHVGDVPRFWTEIRAVCEVDELVSDWDQGAAGIGLVRPAEARDFPRRPSAIGYSGR
jgi:predicted O-methyltransferase YrrM